LSTSCGYRFATFYGGLTPYAAIQSQTFHTPSYNETDLTGGGFALGFNARNATDMRSELGGRFDRLLLLNPDAALTLRARCLGARLDQRSLARPHLPHASERERHRKWRDASEELGAYLGRRRASACQWCDLARQVRRRVCLTLATYENARG